MSGLMSTITRPTLALTIGEPAGIGPEISIRAAWALRDTLRCVLVGDAALLSILAHEIDPAIDLAALTPMSLRNSGLPRFGHDRLTVIDCPLEVPVQAGILDVRNGRSVLQTLDLALEGVAATWFDGIVTAPLQKSIINQAGVVFSGHTEYLAQKTNTEQVVMMLAGQQAGEAGMLRVALASTHLPLNQVSAAITRDGLLRTIQIIHHDLQQYFALPQPRILVAGLNPHAGENGYLGREEIDVIEPTLQAARELGINVSGPYPADTLFQPKYLRDADCVLAMYHDQGLPVLKYATFGQGVNITLGLPLIRTSVDHGTALDLAAQGVGRADFGSMLQAIQCAAQMVASAKAGAGNSAKKRI
jgi:4-hydroxythreonine-4-phosphate dehydrogenase